MTTKQEKIHNILKSLTTVKDYSSFEATKLINDLLLANQGIAGFVTRLYSKYQYFYDEDNILNDYFTLDCTTDDTDNFVATEICLLEERNINWILRTYLQDKAYSLSNSWFTLNPDLDYFRRFDREYNKVLNELLEALEIYFLTEITPA